MQTSWDYIRTFQAVALTGSLSAAARKLGLTQPTVGRHIDLLEADLKVPLFTRSRDGMRLTETGESLVASAAELSDAAAAFERRASGLEEAASGTVRISANEVLGIYALPKCLAQVREEHPEIEFELVASNDVSKLLQRDADIAIRMFRPTQNDLVARKLSELPLGFYAHKDYLARHGTPEQFADLKRFGLIGYDRDASFIRAAASFGETFVRSDFTFRTDSILAQFEAVRAGMGIGVLHCELARNWHELERVLPDLPIPPVEVWIACHMDVRYNRRVRLVMDALSRSLKTPYD